MGIIISLGVAVSHLTESTSIGSESVYFHSLIYSGTLACQVLSGFGNTSCQFFTTMVASPLISVLSDTNSIINASPL